MTDIERYGRRLDLDVLRDQFAPAASDVELEHWAFVCRRLNLDPYSDQIVLIGRNRKIRMRNDRGQEYDGWKLVHRPQITVAGRRAIAARTGRLRGIVGPEWCGPRRYDADGNKLPLEWLEVWDQPNDQPPYAARCLVWPADWQHPANGTCRWAEFAQWTGEGDRAKLSPLWARMPSHMLGKTAESLALRRAFPEVDAAVAYAESRDAVEADDAAIIAEAEATRSLPVTPDDDAVPPDVYDRSPEARGYSSAP